MDQIGSWADPTRTQVARGLEVGGQPVKESVYEVARIHFPTNSSSLDERDKSRLDFVAEAYHALLTSSPRPLKFYIVGFADERGSDALNIALSTKRAETVFGYFRGVLMPDPAAVRTPVNFVVHGSGKASEPADSPLVSGVALRRRGDSPPSAARWQALARWRRVSIYANVSGAPVKAGIQRLRQSLKKAAGQAYRGHQKQLENLEKLVDTYKRRVGRGYNSLTDHNTVFMVWYETRLKDRKKSYEELKKAIDTGDEAFLQWMRQKRRPYSDFAREVTARLRQEVERLRKEQQKASPESKALIQEIIEGLEQNIEFLEDELKCMGK